MAEKIKLLSAWFLLSLMCVSSGVRSQVILMPQVPVSGIIIKQQLWNVMINNLSGQMRQVRLVVSLTDQTTGQPVLEATSGVLLLGSGVKRVMYSDLSPVLFTVSAMGFGTERTHNQPLPVGEYLVCYRLLESGGKDEVLTTECVRLSAEPLAPPQLVYPENAATILTGRPVLTWTPPAPLNMFGSLQYEVKVCPLYENQSPQEALQRNLPAMGLLTAGNSLGYPSSFSDLVAGRTYVWQVVALDAGRLGGKSEVFSFSVMPDSVAQIVSAAPYVKLEMHEPQNTTLHQGFLKMEYFNSGSDSVVRVELAPLKNDHTNRRNAVSFTLNIKPGQNFLQYSLPGRLRLDELMLYGITLINGRGERWVMRVNPKYYF